ncbi:MAG: ROK family protein [Clostridia bacterium]
MNDKAMNTMKVKKINKNKVYKYIYDNKTTCKLEITRALEMGLSTVSQNLQILEKENLIEKNGFFESTGGRKADAVQIVKNAHISVGVAILKESIDIVAVNLYGEIINSKIISIPFSMEKTYYKLIGDNINLFIKENAFEHILGVSIAMQGIISKDGSEVSYGDILSNEHLKLAFFEEYIDYPCRMEHDSKAAAALELWKNKDIENAVVILLNKNLGGAIISNGIIQNGNKMRSGTIEHICIDPNGEKCYCGNKGCLETFCSGDALKAKSKMGIGRFFDLLLQKDKKCLSIWEDYLNILAKAIATLYTVIDGKIIISGVLAWYFNENDLQYLIKKTNEQLTFKISGDDLILSTQGQFTQSVGTALYYINEFLEK